MSQSDADAAREFLTEIVESRGLALHRLGETKAGGLRLDIEDPNIGPLFGSWTVTTAPPSEFYDAAAIICDIERACDRICADEGRLPNAFDVADLRRAAA